MMSETTHDRVFLMVDILRSQAPGDAMTEATRIHLTGEVSGHDQAGVTELLAVIPAAPRHSTRVEYAQLLLQLLSGPPTPCGTPALNVDQPAHGPAADRLRNLLRATTPYDRAEANARQILANPNATQTDVTDALRQVLNSLDASGA